MTEGKSRHKSGRPLSKSKRPSGAKPRGRAKASRPRAPKKPPPADQYLLQIRFDENKDLFVGTVAEVPALSVEAGNRDEVFESLTIALEDYLIDREHEGASLPLPLYTKEYPETLELKVSADLFRRLELRSLQERVDLERLAAEILAAGLQTRGEKLGRRGTESRGGRQPNNNGSDRNHGHRDGNRNSRRGQRPQGSGKRGFNYHDTMDSRENFMDYVRKLEKRK